MKLCAILNGVDKKYDWIIRIWLIYWKKKWKLFSQYINPIPINQCVIINQCESAIDVDYVFKLGEFVFCVT